LDSTKKQELIYFQELKTEVRNEVESKLNIRKEFKDWSGADIQTFQIDLEEKCKSSVSEKWVYLHFKNDSEKLPRIDVLNLLSQYCGFKNWDDFKQQRPTTNQTKKENKTLRTPVLLLLAIALLPTLYFLIPKNETMVFVFEDAYTRKPVPQNELTLKFGQNRMKSKGSLSIGDLKSSDTLTVNGAYYKTTSVYVDAELGKDTMVIKLFPDDYALMLNYFSRSEHNDWDKRKRQLEEAIHEDAIIFQSHPKYDGIEMLNKEEFIERLLLPINSLKNLEIQDIVYKEEQIYNLRFVQKDN
jgi:hypothetical protein